MFFNFFTKKNKNKLVCDDVDVRQVVVVKVLKKYLNKAISK